MPLGLKRLSCGSPSTGGSIFDHTNSIAPAINADNAASLISAANRIQRGTYAKFAATPMRGLFGNRASSAMAYGKPCGIVGGVAAEFISPQQGQQGARTMAKDIIEIRHNGDPYGCGFVGSMSTDNGDSWTYRGDIGAQSRQWWRAYCRRNGYTLREER